MKAFENGKYRDMQPDEVASLEATLNTITAPEPDRLTALELAVAELGAVMAAAMGGMSNG